MNTTATHVVLVTISLAVAMLFCVLVAAATGVLARLSGANPADAFLRGGAAFAGSAVLVLALLTFLRTAV